MSVTVSNINIQATYDGNNAEQGLKRLTNTIKGVSTPAQSVSASMGRITESVALASDKVSILAWKLESAKSKLSQLINSDKQDIGAIARATEQVQKLQGQYNELTNAEERAKEKAKDVGNTTVKSTKKAQSGLSKLLGALKRIALYRLLRTVIKEITESFREGVQNIAKYSSAMNGLDSNNANKTMSELATSALYLKNALGTIAIPILNIITPALNALINMVVSAINVINQLIATLRGLGTFTKAKVSAVDYAKSLDKAGGSAKKLKNALLGIDELNVISKDDDSGSGGSNVADMFEEAPVDDFWKNLMKKLKDFFSKLKSLWDRAKADFLRGWNEIADKLDFKGRIEKLKGYLKGIADSLKEIFTDPGVQEAMMNFFDSFFYNLGRISASVFSVGLSIAENLFGGLDKYLSDNKDRIKEHLITMFDVGSAIMDSLGDLAETIATVFMALGSEAGINFTAKLIEAITETWFTVSETIGKLARDLLNLIVQPLYDNRWKIEEFFEGVLEIGTTFVQAMINIFKPMFDKLRTLYDEHLSPLISRVAEGLSYLLGIILDMFNNYINPLINMLVEFLGLVFEEFLVPIFDYLVEKLAWLIDILGVIWEVLEGLFAVFLTGLESMFAQLQIFLTFFKDVFTVGIDQAWKNLKINFNKYLEEMRVKWNSVWENMVSGLKDSVNKIINNINKMVESVETGINAIIDCLNALNIEIPPWVPVYGGQSFKLSLSHVSVPRIPTFATGGFPTMGQLFIANESGAEMVGSWGNQTAVVNNEQIVSGIKQGVAEAVSGVLAPYLSEIAYNTNAVANKDFSVSIGDREIARANARGQAEMGMTILGTV